MEVKPFLEVDRTEDDSNRYPNGKEFNICDVSRETSDKWNLWYKTKNALDKKLSLPLFFMYLPYFFLLLGFTVTLEIVSYLFGRKNIPNEKYFLIIIFIAVISYGLYFLLPRIYNFRGNILIKKEEFANCIKKRDELQKQSQKELNIPDDYILADVLFFHYRLINGKVTPISLHKKSPPYENTDYFFYKENNNFCVSTVFDSFAVPLETMQYIRKVNDSVRTFGWNKRVPYTDPMYRKHIESADGKHITFTHYYILEFSHNGTLWGLYFPPYELPIFEKLTGLKAEKNN